MDDCLAFCLPQRAIDFVLWPQAIVFQYVLARKKRVSYFKHNTIFFISSIEDGSCYYRNTICKLQKIVLFLKYAIELVL